ncbi:MAG: hypothetical protein RLY88_483 [Actinomycetota bacterium]
MSFFDHPRSQEQSGKKGKSRRFAGLAFLIVAMFGLLAAFYLPTGYVIEQPGPTFNVLGAPDGTAVIEIPDAPTYKTSGHLDLLTVSVVGNREQTPSWIDIFSAWLDPAKSVVPLDEIFPPNQTTKQSELESSAMMEVSQQEAIAASLSQLGYKVPVFIYVSEVAKQSPASGKFIAADYVTAVDGVNVKNIDELRAQVNKYDGKNSLIVSIVRDGVAMKLSIDPIQDETGAWRMGVTVGYKYDFPVNVKLHLADVGGPSGGMMFALGIYDKLTPGELTGAKNIAGTGTINSSGLVGPIGGIRQKMYGAQNGGAAYFLAPADNCNEVIGNIPAGLKVFKVSTFVEAIKIVSTIGKSGDLANLPTCSK